MRSCRFIFGVFLMVLGGCSAPVESWIGLQCDADHPCKEELVCDRGTCERYIAAPEVIPECSLDLHCENTLGIPQVCYKETGTCVRCLEDGDCAPNFCTGYPTFECVGCLENRDCPTGQICNADSAFCIPDAPQLSEIEEERVRK